MQKPYVKRFFLMTAMVIMLTFLGSFGIAQELLTPRSQLFGPFQMVRVIDGEKFIIDLPDFDETVRLLGVKATEVEDAAFTLGQILSGRNIWLELSQPHRDRQGNIQAYIYILDEQGDWSYQGQIYSQLNQLLGSTGYIDEFDLSTSSLETTTNYSLPMVSISNLTDLSGFHGKIDRQNHSGMFGKKSNFSVFRPPLGNPQTEGFQNNIRQANDILSRPSNSTNIASNFSTNITTDVATSNSTNAHSTLPNLINLDKMHGKGEIQISPQQASHLPLPSPVTGTPTTAHHAFVSLVDNNPHKQTSASISRNVSGYKNANEMLTIADAARVERMGPSSEVLATIDAVKQAVQGFSNVKYTNEYTAANGSSTTNTTSQAANNDVEFVSIPTQQNTNTTSTTNSNTTSPNTNSSQVISVKFNVNQCVDVNHAPINEIMTLTGINDFLAEKIIVHRPYATLTDLGRVSGITATIISNIKKQDLICFGESSR